MSAASIGSTALAVIALAAVVSALLRAWGPARLRARDRLGLVGALADALAALLAQRTLTMDPAPGAGWPWVAALVVTGIAASGLILRWDSLPVHAPRPGARPRAVSAWCSTGASVLLAASLAVVGR